MDSFALFLRLTDRQTPVPARKRAGIPQPVNTWEKGSETTDARMDTDLRAWISSFGFSCVSKLL